MTAYLTVAEFSTRSIMPSVDVDYLEAQHPGYLDARLAVNQSRIHARLGKRYAWPFAVPVPEIVLGWIVALTTVDAYQKRGWDPSDAQSAQVILDRDKALEEAKEAADAEGGLFELPLREDLTASAVAVGGPYGSSEATAYAWIDAQRDAADLEGR